MRAQQRTHPIQHPVRPKRPQDRKDNSLSASAAFEAGQGSAGAKRKPVNSSGRKTPSDVPRRSWSRFMEHKDGATRG